MKRKIFLLLIMLLCVLFVLLSCRSKKENSFVTDRDGNVISDVVGNGGNALENSPSQSSSVGTFQTGNYDTSEDLPDPKYLVTYEQYSAMSESEQIAHFESFASVEEFFSWYNAAKAKYEETRTDVEELTGDIDLGGIN
jgi:hypothetical protein